MIASVFLRPYDPGPSVHLILPLTRAAAISIFSSRANIRAICGFFGDPCVLPISQLRWHR